MQSQKRPRSAGVDCPQQGSLARARCDEGQQELDIPTGNRTPGRAIVLTGEAPPQQQQKQLAGPDPVQLPAQQAALQQQAAAASRAQQPQAAAQQPQQAAIKGPADEPAEQPQPPCAPRKAASAAAAAPGAAAGKFRLQQGQVLVLESMQQIGYDLGHLQRTGEQWQLQVQRPLGAGATGEAYEVAVLSHTPNAAGDPGASPPAPLCLKIPRVYEAVPGCLRDSLFKTPAHLIARSTLSLQEQHRVMRLLSSCSSVPASYAFGSLGMKEAQDGQGGSDSSSSELLPALLMELGSDGSLEKLISTEGWGCDESRDVMYSVALALQQLHAAGYAHLDVKPSNLTQRSSGGGDVSTGGPGSAKVYQLIDYGSVFFLGQRSRAVLPPSGITGTPGFMPPELYQRTVTRAGDVYSLGILLFALRSGRTLDPLPLTDNQLASGQALAKVQSSPLWPQLGPDEQQLISSCLQAGPWQRPSIQQVLDLPYFAAHTAAAGSAAPDLTAQQHAPCSTGGSNSQAAGGPAAASSKGDMQQAAQQQRSPAPPSQLQPNSMALLHTQRQQPGAGGSQGAWVPDGGEISLAVGPFVGSEGRYDFFEVKVEQHKLPGPVGSQPLAERLRGEGGGEQQLDPLLVEDLTGQRMWLKVPRPYVMLPPGLQQFAADAEAHSSSCTSILQQEHRIMSQPRMRASPWVLRDWGFGQVEQGDFSCSAILLEAADTLLNDGQALLGGVGSAAVGVVTGWEMVNKLLFGLTHYAQEGFAYNGLRPGVVVASKQYGLKKIFKLLGCAEATECTMEVSPQLHKLLGRYASPEMRRPGFSNSKEDAWSVGMLLLELRTGLPPFAHLALLPEAEAVSRYKQELDPELSGTGFYSDLSKAERVFVRDCLGLSSPTGYLRPDVVQLKGHAFFLCAPKG